MNSSESVAVRPWMEDPESDWAEHEFTCWSPRDEPWFALFTAAVSLTVVMASWAVSKVAWMPALAALGSLIASCRTWLPSVYRIGPLGIRHRLFRRWVLIPWKSVVGIRQRPAGIVIKTNSSQHPFVPPQILYIHGGRATEELTQLVQRFSGITPN
ncbi:MAG: hypothetical protein O2931_15800 [Planctomycetota bacterium]|nr:hypothetical protein [Planctomycetota bacterium]MDA1180247.1 hypothetical protein [Planctomycetota bacterium]